MIVTEAGPSWNPFPPRTQESSVGPTEVLQDEAPQLSAASMNRGSRRLGRLRRGHDRHRVPRGEHLVVRPRPDPGLSRLEERASRRGEMEPTRL